jgi:hypothetical protein
MRLFAFLLLFCLTAAGTQAHERSESTSHWIYANGELHGILTSHLREVTRLTVPDDTISELPRIFAAHVRNSLSARVDAAPCSQAALPAILDSEPGYVRVDVRMHCPSGNRLTLRLDTFFTVAPSHHHFIYVESGGEQLEAILSISDPELSVSLRPHDAPRTHFLQFVRMGIEHIATGIDHIAFLLALLISARTPKQILAVVTGFTAGHSLTLTLAVLGIVQADREAVECLIGLTIALAAAQNLIRGEREGRIAGAAAVLLTGCLLYIPPANRPGMPASLILSICLTTGAAVWLASLRRSDFTAGARFSMAAAFGLIHGLGFAGALQDLHLPRSLLVPTLFGFNVGVEVGQLLLVVAAVLLVRAAVMLVPHSTQRSGVFRDAASYAASAALLAAGLAWFATRVVIPA